MNLCHPTVFPMKAGLSLILDQVEDHLLTDIVVYQQSVGKLRYLACGTKSDIAFVVRQLNRHNSDPQEGHIHIIKQTLQYLKRISSMEII